MDNRMTIIIILVLLFLIMMASTSYAQIGGIAEDEEIPFWQFALFLVVILVAVYIIITKKYKKKLMRNVIPGS